MSNSEGLGRRATRSKLSIASIVGELLLALLFKGLQRFSKNYPQKNKTNQIMLATKNTYEVHF